MLGHKIVNEHIHYQWFCTYTAERTWDRVRRDTAKISFPHYLLLFSPPYCFPAHSSLLGNDSFTYVWCLVEYFLNDDYLETMEKTNFPGILLFLLSSFHPKPHLYLIFTRRERDTCFFYSANMWSSTFKLE